MIEVPVALRTGVAVDHDGTELWEGDAVADRSWDRFASCGLSTASLFATEAAGAVAEARRVCAPCRVRSQCLVRALTLDLHGVAGGLTRRERKIVARRWTAGTRVAVGV